MRVFVAVLTITTCACGTTAPDESRTVPVMPPVNDCANAGNASAQTNETNERILYILTPTCDGLAKQPDASVSVKRDGTELLIDRKNIIFHALKLPSAGHPRRRTAVRQEPPAVSRRADRRPRSQ